MKLFFSTLGRYVLLTSIGSLSGIGACQLYDDLVGDGRLPVFGSLEVTDPALQLSVYHNSTRHAFANFEERTDHWDLLEPTVDLVRGIAPEIAEWLEEMQRSGRIRYDADSDVLAGFDFLSRKLTISRKLFCEVDGSKAACLIHEYRHHRQNFSKVVRYTLSFVAYRDGVRSIVENDAHIYEAMAYSALGMHDYTSGPSYLLCGAGEEYRP